MKVVDIERVIILMRFIQFGWTEERKKAFDEDLRMMLETQCEDLADHDKQIGDRVKTCDGCKNDGKWENEIEYGYNSPCTLCSRRCSDNYEEDERGAEE